MHFLLHARAVAVFPGGFGTVDEAFELLTLIQTGKSDLHPVVLLEPAGSMYWKAWDDFIRAQVLARAFISPDDVSLYKVASSVEEAVDEIERFYSNYRSARFVGDRLVLRLKRAPDDAALERLQHDFADLLDHGSFEVVPPTPPELREGDTLDAERVAFYPKHAYGRIRQLIDVLNDLPRD